MIDSTDLIIACLVVFYHVVLYVAIKRMIDISAMRSYIIVTTQDYLERFADSVEGKDLWEKLATNQVNEKLDDSEPEQ